MRDTYGTRVRIYPHTTQPTFPPTPPPPCPLLNISSLSADLLSSLESFHPPELDKNLGGAEIGWGGDTQRISPEPHGLELGTGIGHWNWGLELVEFQSIGTGIV